MLTCRHCEITDSDDKFPLGATGKRVRTCKRCIAARNAGRRRHDPDFRRDAAIYGMRNRGTHVCDIAKHRAAEAAREARRAPKARPVVDIEARAADRRMDKLMRSRQARGTHVCDIAEYRAEQARRAAEAAERTAAATERAERKRAAAEALLASRVRKPSTSRDMSSDDARETLLHGRIRSHVKAQRRRHGRTHFRITRANFAELLGYTIADLRHHLTTFMPAGYDWPDVAAQRLCIDHRFPAAAFDLTTLAGLRGCYALDNLQWLTPLENACKAGTADRIAARVFGVGQ